MQECLRAVQKRRYRNSAVWPQPVQVLRVGEEDGRVGLERVQQGSPEWRREDEWVPVDYDPEESLRLQVAEDAELVVGTEDDELLRRRLEDGKLRLLKHQLYRVRHLVPAVEKGGVVPIHKSEWA